jgi:hypothetical protein
MSNQFCDVQAYTEMIQQHLLSLQLYKDLNLNLPKNMFLS